MSTRFYRPLTRGQLGALASQVGGGYEYANRFVGVLARAEERRTVLLEQGVHVVGVEFEALPDAETYEVTGGVVGVTVLWFTTGSTEAERGPFVYAFARRTDSGPGPIDRPETPNVIEGSLFVAHCEDAASATQASFIDSMQHVGLGSGTALSGVVSGEFVTFVPVGGVFGTGDEPPRWYGFAGSLHIRTLDSGHAPIRYDTVRYEHFEWLLGQLRLRPGGSTVVPEHEYTTNPGGTRGRPRWAPLPGTPPIQGTISLVVLDWNSAVNIPDDEEFARVAAAISDEIGATRGGPNFNPDMVKDHVLNSLSDETTVLRVGEQFAALASTRHPHRLDPALVLAVGVRESGRRIFRGSGSSQSFDQGGLDHIHQELPRLRRQGYIPDGVGTRWERGRNTVTEGGNPAHQAVIPNRELLIAYGAVLMARQQQFLQEASHPDLGFDISTIDERSLRAWTQIYFGGPGALEYDTFRRGLRRVGRTGGDRGRYVASHFGGKTVLTWLDLLVTEGDAEGLNDIYNIQEFREYRRVRRGLVTGGEAELIGQYYVWETGNGS